MTFKEAFESGYRFRHKGNFSKDVWWSSKNDRVYVDHLNEYLSLSILNSYKWLSNGWETEERQVKTKEFLNKLDNLINEA